MRIGLFAHRLAQAESTGIGRYVRELASALNAVASERNAIVLASTPEPERAAWIPDGVESRGVRWPRRVTQAAWCLGVGPRLEQSVGRLDVVHLTHAFPPVRTAAPQVVTVHDLFPLERPDWYPRSERWSYRRSIRLALERATRVVVPSRYVADRLAVALDVPRGLIEVVPHGVNGAFAGARSTREIAASCNRFGLEPERFVVSVGAVSARKNVITLVRAVAQLHRAPVPLVLIGADGHGAAEVDAEIARLDGANRVIRTGYLSDVETGALVQGAAVLAHPAIAEGFGMVPLEAMAAGTPVIAGRVSSIPEVVGEAAVLVDEPTEPAAWAAALSDVMRSSERRRELAARGQRRARSFSWPRTAETMLGIYADVARS